MGKDDLSQFDSDGNEADPDKGKEELNVSVGILAQTSVVMAIQRRRHHRSSPNYSAVISAFEWCRQPQHRQGRLVVLERFPVGRVS